MGKGWGQGRGEKCVEEGRKEGGREGGRGHTHKTRSKKLILSLHTVSFKPGQMIVRVHQISHTVPQTHGTRVI